MSSRQATSQPLSSTSRPAIRVVTKTVDVQLFRNCRRKQPPTNLFNQSLFGFLRHLIGAHRSQAADFSQRYLPGDLSSLVFVLTSNRSP
jgi:hypothetical protein